MTTCEAPADDRSAGAHNEGNNLSSIVPDGALDPARVDAARRWFAELLGDLGTGGYVWLALRDGDGWHETGPFRPGAGAFARSAGGQLAGLPADELLEVLARSSVASSGSGDVFACPYPQAPLGRRKGAARIRRHVHCDIDGPVDMGKANLLGAMVVASGSVADGGQPYGHVYIRLDRPVTALEHEALCRGLAMYVGGACADLTKVTDENVLRVPGTLNHKTTPAHPVEWLVGPDDKRVRSGWDPEDLARLLHVEWPVSEPTGEVDDVPETPTGSGAVQTAAGRPGEDGLHPYAARAIGAELARLDDAADWPAGIRDERGKGWESVTFSVACNLLEFANSPWSGYSAELARTDLLEHVPRDRGFGPVQHEEKWKSAVKKIRGKGRPEPVGKAPDRRPEGPRRTSGGTDDAEITDMHEDREESPEDATDEGRARPSWRPLDLTATVAGLQDGTLKRVRPTVGQLSLTDDEDLFLLYRGKVNGLAGESGCGKTWTALTIGAQEIAAGRAVVYVDLEDDHVSVVTRLLAMGASPDDVLARFHYLSPVMWMRDPDWDDLAALLDEVCPALVVVDSVGEGLSMAGANPNADEEVALWFRRLPRRLARHETGPAVLVLDHTTKAASDGLWPIGSQRKRAAITGVQYMQRTLRPFKRGKAGAAVLVCAKDRLGNYATGERVAELHLAPTGEAEGVGVDLVCVVGRPDDETGDEPEGDEKPMDKVRREAASKISAQVVAYVAEHPGKSTRAVERALRKSGLRIRNGAVSDALSVAEECRAVTGRRSGSATLWYPYEPPAVTEDGGQE